MTIPAEPMLNKTSSGFMLLSKKRATDPAKIRTDFAHEFFHVLQMRHNNTAMAADTGVVIHGKTVFQKSWFCSRPPRRGPNGSTFPQRRPTKSIFDS